nr:hypothetical transcript [Hymenolepis microstoma]
MCFCGDTPLDYRPSAFYKVMAYDEYRNTLIKRNVVIPVNPFYSSTKDLREFYKTMHRRASSRWVDSGWRHLSWKWRWRKIYLRPKIRRFSKSQITLD